MLRNRPPTPANAFPVEQGNDATDLVRIGSLFPHRGGAGLRAHRALGPVQKARAEHRYEYKVVCFSYNPGERLSDDARAMQFERLLNDYARNGWELVTDLLNRSNVQTVGGGVTTRDTITFVAFRRHGRAITSCHSGSSCAPMLCWRAGPVRPAQGCRLRRRHRRPTQRCPSCTKPSRWATAAPTPSAPTTPSTRSATGPTSGCCSWTWRCRPSHSRGEILGISSDTKFLGPRSLRTLDGQDALRGAGESDRPP